jgi:protein required for attachment to host cells
MLKFKRPVVLQLRDGELIRCDQARLVRVVQGRVWVTQMHDPDDHFLHAGHTLALRAGARAIVGAEGAAQVTFVAAPSWLGTLRQRLSRSAGAARSRTIAAWTCPPTS